MLTSGELRMGGSAYIEEIACGVRRLMLNDSAVNGFSISVRDITEYKALREERKPSLAQRTG